MPERIIVFTRTDWNETPRLRHQVAKLLLEKGHEVTFVEAPQFNTFKSVISAEANFRRFRHFQLLHHQLKPFRFLQAVSSKIASNILSAHFQADEFDVVINFNYDYSFSKEIFKSARFITIINDDFEAQAKPWMRSAIRKQLMRTCAVSDAVMTVSTPLLSRLRTFSEDAELFMPWSETPYRQPGPGDRRICLYYGFLNHRIDYGVFDYLLAHGTKLRVVGPIQTDRASQRIDELSKSEAFEYLTPRPLEEVPLDDVCCSIVPYDTNVKSVLAVSAGNRAFRLLSFGIPVVYPDLPGLESSLAPAIAKAATAQDFLSRLAFYRENFEQVQDDIVRVLAPHSPDSRYAQLARHFKAA